MRNAVPRRSHRERAQPHVRARKGILEKRKDYVLRSQDYKRKQTAIKRLSEKAAEKNPDEFYFGMVNQGTRRGIAIAERPGSESLGIKEIMPLKIQDMAYLRTVRNIERSRIEKLKNVVPEIPVGNKKILFAENEDEGLAPFIAFRGLTVVQLRNCERIEWRRCCLVGRGNRRKQGN
jgi:U3 small nucleolar RNA-associated protein 11